MYSKISKHALDPSLIETKLSHYFWQIICKPPFQFFGENLQQISSEQLSQYLYALSDFNYMLAAYLVKAGQQNKAGGVSETKAEQVKWCRARLGGDEKNTLTKFLQLKCIAILESKIVGQRLEYADIYTEYERPEDQITGSMFLSLSGALSVLQECIEEDTVGIEDQKATVHNLGAMWSTPKDVVKTNEELSLLSYVEKITDEYLKVQKYVKPCLLINRFIPEKYSCLYQYFNPICIANVGYTNLGAGKTSFYFQYHKCLEAQPVGTIVFLSDMFLDHTQFNCIVPLALDSYHCLVLDPQGAGKTTMQLPQQPSIENFSLGIIELLNKLEITSNLVFLGVGYGALLAMELHRLKKDSSFVAIDLPVGELHLKERWYRDIAKVMTFVQCHGYGWLSFDDRQFLNQYLREYYDDREFEQEILHILEKTPIKNEKTNPQDVMKGYVSQLQAMLSYDVEKMLHSFFTKSVPATNRVFYNTKQGEFHSRHLRLPVNEKAAWPFKWIQSTVHSKKILEDEGGAEPLWSIIFHTLRNKQMTRRTSQTTVQ